MVETASNKRKCKMNGKVGLRFVSRGGVTIVRAEPLSFAKPQKNAPETRRLSVALRLGENKPG